MWRAARDRDRIFVSAEYGPGAAVLRLDGGKLVDVWASDEVLSNHYATSVYYDGHLYGFHGRQEFGPSFRAVELATGKVRWSEDRFRAGSVTLVGNRLLIMREAASCSFFLRRRRVRPLDGRRSSPTVRAYRRSPTDSSTSERQYAGVLDLRR